METPAALPVVAWEVEIRYLRCIVFAATKAKAQWIATRSYWAAYGRLKGEWPRATAARAPRYDRSILRFDEPKAFTEAHVIDSPNR